MDRTPVVSYGVILICVCVYFWMATLEPREEARLILDYGTVPERLFDRGVFLWHGVEPRALATLITAIFLHGGLTHLIFNMICVGFFAPLIERTMGAIRFALFFLLCGAAAGAAHVVLTDDPAVPMIGASGAIAGVFAAVLLLVPKIKVIPFLLPIPIPLYVMIGILAVLHALALRYGWMPGIAWWAHAGGFAAGLALYPLMRDWSVPLFQKGR